ncbi:MAG: HepT-like ribonuclease domain-containing protein [archaeon]
MQARADVLIHGYFGIEIDLVWDIIKRDIPELKKKIMAILDKMQESS